jgi:Protein kinase domain
VASRLGRGIASSTTLGLVVLLTLGRLARPERAHAGQQLVIDVVPTQAVGRAFFDNNLQRGCSFGAGTAMAWSGPLTCVDVHVNRNLARDQHALANFGQAWVRLEGEPGAPLEQLRCYEYVAPPGAGYVQGGVVLDPHPQVERKMGSDGESLVCVHVRLRLVPTTWWGRVLALWYAYADHLPYLLMAALVGGSALLGWRRARRARHEHARQVRALREHSDADELSGRRIGPYRLVSKLGAGGMASVYVAWPDASLDSTESVAIKLITSAKAGDEEYRRRFRREIQACMQAKHPCLMQLIDWGEEAGQLYLVAEHLRGEPLRHKIRLGGLRIDVAWGYLEPVFEGVAYLHDQGLVHRDLKPENVFVCDDGRVKVMDFGLARTSTTNLTQAGGVIGTPGYMAPEQIRAEAVDARADQYALGLIAFELLCGRYPVEATDTVQLLFKHVDAVPLPSILDFKPLLGDALAGVIARMLAKQPGDRYPDVRRAQAALEAACARGLGRKTQAMPSPGREPGGTDVVP